MLRRRFGTLLSLQVIAAMTLSTCGAKAPKIEVDVSGAEGRGGAAMLDLGARCNELDNNIPGAEHILTAKIDGKKESYGMCGVRSSQDGVANIVVATFTDQSGKVTEINEPLREATPAELANQNLNRAIGWVDKSNVSHTLLASDVNGPIMCRPDGDCFAVGGDLNRLVANILEYDATDVEAQALVTTPTIPSTSVPIERPTNTPVPEERFPKDKLINIPKNSKEIAGCPLIASPVDDEQFKKDIDQALYSGAGLQILNDWPEADTIKIPSPTGDIGADFERAEMYAGAKIEPAVCVRFKDHNNQDAVVLGLSAIHADNKFYFLVVPNSDDIGKWESATKKTTVDGLLGELPIIVDNLAMFFTTVQTDKGVPDANTPFLTSILSLPSQQGTGDDLRTCIVSSGAQADIAKLACDRLKYKVSIWGNIQ